MGELGQIRFAYTTWFVVLHEVVCPGKSGLAHHFLIMWTKSTIQMATFVVYYTCLQCERLFELVNWEQTCFAYPIWLLVYHHECVRPGKAS